MASSSFKFPSHSLCLFCAWSIFLRIGASGNQFKFDGRVLELDNSNFDAAIANFDCILVDFYAPWCAHCNRLSPELVKAAPTLAGLKQPVAVAKVDAAKHRNLASKYDVGGYPTLKIFMHGLPTEEYYGPRKADSLIRFLTKFVAPDVAVLGSDSALRDFVEAAGSDFPIFIGFALNESVILNLAVSYKNKAWFSVAKNFSDKIMTMFDFDKVPALAVIHPAYNERSIFYGPFGEKFIEEHIKQSLLPLVLPINRDSLKSLKDDTRKVLLTILEDETAKKYQDLFKVLKVAASANRDFIFGYVGLKQWKDFAESFEDQNKLQLPKMVVWDGSEEYHSVIDHESMGESDMSRHISGFLEGYRDGRVIQKRLKSPAFINSEVGLIIVCILVVVALTVVVIPLMIKEEPMNVGTREHGEVHQGQGRTATTQEHRGTVKED